MVTIEPDNARAVADFHTAFNIVLALIFFPLLSPYARLLRRWLPARVDAADPSQPLYLDPLAVETPVVAIGGAAREALRWPTCCRPCWSACATHSRRRTAG